MKITNEVRSQGSRGRFVLGMLLLAHFAVVCFIKTAQDIPADVWWMSHVALALAGVGLLIESPLLTGAALTAVALPHAVWLVDFGLSRLPGADSMGITRYLEHADLETWLATAHHFYLVPLLLVFVLRDRYRFDRFLLAAALTIAATLVSRVSLPEARNVNWAFRVLPNAELPLLERISGLPAPLYLAMVLGWQIGIMLLPTALLLRRLTRHRPTPCAATARAHARRARSLPDRRASCSSRQPAINSR